MNISKEEFEERFEKLHDQLLEAMAEHPDVSLERFSGMACYLENLAFFSPLFYAILKIINQKSEVCPLVVYNFLAS